MGRPRPEERLLFGGDLERQAARAVSRQKTTQLGVTVKLEDETKAEGPEDAQASPLARTSCGDVGLLTFRASPADAMPPPPPAASFPCLLCERIFAQRSHLLLHEQSHFRQRFDSVAPSEGALVLQPSSSSSSSAFDLPAKGPPKTAGCFACADCSKSFSTRFRLRVHRRLHTGETPYVCQFCGKGFVDRGNFAVHQRVHTREKPYHCPVCGKQFSTKGNLSRHQQSQHSAHFMAMRLA